MSDLLAAPSVEDARAASAAYAADPRVEKVLLFGSVARGKARPDSDIDLLVIVDDDSSAAAVGAHCRPDTEWPVNIVVERSADFEHLSTLSASFECEVAKDAQVVYESVSSGLGGGSARVGTMARDNLDLAAQRAKSAAAQMIKLRDAVCRVASSEAGLADDAESSEVVDWTREVRYAAMLQTAHMAIEQSFRAVAAACDGKNLGGDHDIDRYLRRIDDTPERSALAAAVDPVRGADGKVKNWRAADYVADLPDWQSDVTADNAAAHIEAAIVCARVASDAIRSRSRPEQQSHTQALDRETDRLASERRDAAFIERGTASDLPQRSQR